MKKTVWIVGVVFVGLLGISGTAFAKHHHHHKKEDQENKVPCLVKGVQQMVKSEDACKELKGTLVNAKTPQDAIAESKKKITVQKLQSE